MIIGIIWGPYSRATIQLSSPFYKDPKQSLYNPLIGRFDHGSYDHCHPQPFTSEGNCRLGGC